MYPDSRDEREAMASIEIRPFPTFVTGNENFRLSQYNAVQSDESVNGVWGHVVA
jgi:hypothetical protein